MQEYDASGGLVSSFVYGNYVDETIQREDANGGEFYFHEDDQWNTVALTDVSGSVVERYLYDYFGVPTVLDGAGAPRAPGTELNDRLFQGREYDFETALYNYRARYYDPTIGRFTTRDPLGIWGDVLHLGNGYSFLNHNPWSMIDPFGLEAGSNKIDWASKFAEIFSMENFIDFAKGFFLDGAGGGLKALWDIASSPGEFVQGIRDFIKSVAVDPLGVLGDMANDFINSLTNPRALGELTFNAVMTLTGVGASVAAGLKGLKMMKKLSGGKNSHNPHLTLDTPDLSKLGVCFVAGTLIAVANGNVPIEQVQKGDLVWSYNEETDTIELNEVVRTFTRISDSFVELIIGNDKISATLEHPFWVVGSGWKEAREIRVADFIRTRDGTTATVEAVTRIEGPAVVYNFEVENAHTYFVGHLNLLVHNQCMMEVPKGGTYVLKDAEGNIVRTGQTNNLERRRGEHGRHPDTEGLEFYIDRFSDDPVARRGREQIIYNANPQALAENGGLNKRNPISRSNPMRDQYLAEGEKL